jgi:hypothetical protein
VSGYPAIRVRTRFPLIGSGFSQGIVRDVVLQLNFKGEERKRWGEEGERGSRLIGEGLKRKMLPTDLHGLARIEKG